MTVGFGLSDCDLQYSGLSAFFDVAYALMEIKQRRLYRGEFASFEDYCRNRWNMRRAHAYRLIGAAE